MAQLIRQSRRYDIAPAVSIRAFDALAESIAYQQLNGKAHRMRRFAPLVFRARKLRQ